MKLIIDDFEVEIKAKFKGSADRYNKEATLFLLNHLAVLASEARKSFEVEGAHALANNAQQIHAQLYKYCEDKGAYRYN